MCDRFLSLNPIGMGRMLDTILQKPDRFWTRTWLGISGYTLDNVSRVVGLTRGDSSKKELSCSRPSVTA